MFKVQLYLPAGLRFKVHWTLFNFKAVFNPRPERRRGIEPDNLRLNLNALEFLDLNIAIRNHIAVILKGDLSVDGLPETVPIGEFGF